MRKKISLSFFLILLFAAADAQNFTIKGRLQDEATLANIQGATTELKSLSDSTFVKSTITDARGNFLFSSLPLDSFVIRFSSVGYQNFFKTVYIKNANIELGVISIPKASTELSEVTINATTPPAQQKGDTLQFNASQFKVNPDASAEDLARKVPGLTVENGQVKAGGENVRRVTLDGRELFGDDATAALRNLPAEIVDKIQVFDRLSDQAQATGVNTGETQKEINIVTKANMRNGQFGRAYAGYGTDSRYKVGGNTTFLKENRRISLVGNFNNINQQNFSDQDLLGVTSSGGGGRGGNRGGGGRGGNSNNFLVGQQNGISRTNAFGINYADNWGEKIKLSGSYFFNNAENNTNQESNTQYFLKNIPAYKQVRGATSNNTNHRFNLRMEYQIDSSNRLIITPNISFQNNNSISNTNTLSYFNTTSIQSETNNATNSERKGNNLSNNIFFLHSFPKKGRSFTVNLNTGYNQRSGNVYTDLLTRKYSNGVPVDSLERRFTDQFNNSTNIGANITYTEPLGKNTGLQFSYNPSYTKSSSNQELFNYNTTNDKYTFRNDSLSNTFDNVYKAQNGGITFRSGTRDKQLSFGTNFQQSELNSERIYPRPITVRKTFSNILPNANVRLKLSAASNLRIFYRTATSQPSVTQLQDVTDITSRPFITQGNPDLKQQYSHTLSTNYTFTNTAKGLLFVGNVYAQKMNNYVTNATYIAATDSAIGNGQTLFAGEQLSKPVNLNGYNSLRSFFTFAVPVKFIKSNFNLNGGVTYSQQPGLINYQVSTSQNYTYTLGSVIASNVSQYVDFTLSYSANFNTVKNKLQLNLNNNYFSHQAGMQFNLLSKNGWVLQNELTNQLYKGLTEGFNQNYWLWNISAGKKLLKDDKGELRLSVFDLLKQNRSIVRDVTEAYIKDTRNVVLQQYFMLTFTYNLRNFGKAANSRGNTNENMNNRGAFPGGRENFRP